MKRILIGTTNPSKLKRFEGLLSGFDVEFLTLNDLGITQEPEETGITSVENAAIKAKFYGAYFDSVVCNDSGLYFDSLDISDPRQPGLKIRTPFGKRLDDDEMISYYSSLIRSLGGKVTAYYDDGIAVFERGKISTFSKSREDALKAAFYMTDTPSPKRHPGWPLDSISINIESGRYFVDGDSKSKSSVKENVIKGSYRARLIEFLKNSLEL